MLSHTTWLISKLDPVKYIYEKPALTGRIARWQVLLSEFNIVYVTQKAIKGSALADYLAQQPLLDYRPMHPEFPDEDIMALFEEKRTHEDIDKWIVCFDGASNALGHGVGAVLVSPDDQCIPFTVSYPNFVRGPLLDDMRPFFGPCEVLGIHHWAICEIQGHAEKPKKY